MRVRRRRNREEMERDYHRLCWQNLKLRLELEVIAERPDSKAAKRILDRYRKKIAVRNEALKALQN